MPVLVVYQTFFSEVQTARSPNGVRRRCDASRGPHCATLTCAGRLQIPAFIQLGAPMVLEVARYGLLRTRACIYGLLLNQSERSSASTWRQRSVTPPGVPGTLECLAHPCRACIPSLGVGACASDQTSPLNPQCHASSRAELRAEPRPPSEVMHDPEMALLVAVLAQRSEMAKLARGHAAPSQRGHY